ncbi:hypothetical protein KM043_002913 [Ampulex compressa]|nr:hypothetical protein KM043_002913 [Ampulex compressa]
MHKTLGNSYKIRYTAKVETSLPDRKVVYLYPDALELSSSLRGNGRAGATAILQVRAPKSLKEAKASGREVILDLPPMTNGCSPGGRGNAGDLFYSVKYLNGELTPETGETLDTWRQADARVNK